VEHSIYGISRVRRMAPSWTQPAVSLLDQTNKPKGKKLKPDAPGGIGHATRPFKDLQEVKIQSICLIFYR